MSSKNNQNKFIEDGIVNYHVKYNFKFKGYALFDMQEIYNQKLYRLLKVRNTWGNTEYTGKIYYNKR